VGNPFQTGVGSDKIMFNTIISIHVRRKLLFCNYNGFIPESLLWKEKFSVNIAEGSRLAAEI
jgi:hypothetical protein